MLNDQARFDLRAAIVKTAKGHSLTAAESALLSCAKNQHAELLEDYRLELATCRQSQFAELALTDSERAYFLDEAASICVLDGVTGEQLDLVLNPIGSEMGEDRWASYVHDWLLGHLLQLVRASSGQSIQLRGLVESALIAETIELFEERYVAYIQARKRIVALYGHDSPLYRMISGLSERIREKQQAFSVTGWVQGDRMDDLIELLERRLDELVEIAVYDDFSIERSRLIWESLKFGDRHVA